MKNILIGLGALLIIGGGAYLLFAQQGEVTYTSAVAEDNAVLLVDQPSNSEATVSYAKLSKPGYVRIEATNPQTGVKDVLGVSPLLPVGEHRNIKITYVSPHTRGSATATIQASIVADNGDGMYNEADTDVLLAADETTQAHIDENAGDPESLSASEIANLLDDAGYTVADDASVAIDELETSVEASTTVEDETQDPGIGDESSAAGTFPEGQVPSDVSDEDAATQ